MIHLIFPDTEKRRKKNCSKNQLEGASIPTADQLGSPVRAVTSWSDFVRGLRKKKNPNRDRSEREEGVTGRQASRQAAAARGGRAGYASAKARGQEKKRKDSEKVDTERERGHL